MVMLEQTTLEIHYSYHHCSWVVKMTTIESPIHFQNMAIIWGGGEGCMLIDFGQFDGYA